MQPNSFPPTPPKEGGLTPVFVKKIIIKKDENIAGKSGFLYVIHDAEEVNLYPSQATFSFILEMQNREDDVQLGKPHSS